MLLQGSYLSDIEKIQTAFKWTRRNMISKNEFEVLFFLIILINFFFIYF
jgi:hypothetical protein